MTGTMTTRRRFLAMVATSAGAALAACGGGKATDTPLPGTTTTTPFVVTATATGTVGAGPASLAASAVPGSGIDATPAPLLAIEAVEYGFRTNGSVAAGTTMVQMKNLGQEDHQAQFLRLNDGVTPAQVQDALKDPRTLGRLTTLVGGPGTIGARGMSAAMMDLKEGRYLLACFVPDRDEVSHAAKGMVLPLMVTAATGAGMPMPATQGTVTMKEFSFALSTSALPTGRSMVAVTNEGAQPHEFAVLRLMPGKTAADVTRYFTAPPAGPPPFVAAGGLTALSPGQRGIAALDLTPGGYAAVCFLPDAASGKEHLQLGMIAGFVVA